MDVGMFAQQMSPFIFMMVGAFVLMMVYIMFLRPMIFGGKKRGETTEITTTPTAPSALDQLRQAQVDEFQPEPVKAKITTGDLPDLDTLLGAPAPIKAKAPAAPKVAAPSAAPAMRTIGTAPQALKLPDGQITHATEVMTILRDENDGRLMIQLGATGYRTLLDSPEAKKEFSRLMNELREVILKPDTRPVEESPVPAEFTAEPVLSEPTFAEELPSLGDLVKSKPAPEPKTPEPPQPKRTVAPPPLPDGIMPGKLPSYKFDDNPAKVEFNRSGMVKKVEFTPPPTADIPSAIEAYLQYKLEYTPEFQGRGLHVRGAADGSVRIQVGNTFFESIDDISDSDVRQFMKEMIAEWQDNQ